MSCIQRPCTAEDVIQALTSLQNEEQRIQLSRFFKTAKGEYGEGDKFLGIKVPLTRSIAKKYRLLLDFNEIKKLLRNEFHEVRLCGFLLIVSEMESVVPKRGNDNIDSASRRDEIANFYLKNARYANNWDLVDLSCYKILGPWLIHRDNHGHLPYYDILIGLSGSKNLWEQRIAIVTTMAFIREGDLRPTLHISELLLCHEHDLIHKAVGWLLREVGKRDVQALLTFLDKHIPDMHRTTLRYAIEKLPEDIRQYYLHL